MRLRVGAKTFRPSDDVNDPIERREAQNRRWRCSVRRAHGRIWPERPAGSPDEKNSARTPWDHMRLPAPSAGPCRGWGVCVYGGEDDSGRYASQETCLGVTAANRQPPTDWRRTARRVTTKPGEAANHRRGRRRHRSARAMVTIELNARSPRWFARNVRQVCDGALSRSRR